MEKQELFNKAYIGVTKQGCPATGHTGACEYRVPDKGDGVIKMCALGHVMNGVVPDDSPIWGIEGDVEAVQDWLRFNPTEPMDWLLDNEMAKLTSCVQLSHDNAARAGSAFTNSFQAAMQQVANRFHLTIPEVEGNEQNQA